MFGHRYFGARYFGRRYFGPGFPPDTGTVTGTEAADTLTSSAAVARAQEAFFRFGGQFERRRRHPPITAELDVSERRDGLVAFARLGFDPELIDADFLAIAA